MLIEADIHAAAAVAAKIHHNDTRKFSGLPYIVQRSLVVGSAVLLNVTC